MIDFGMALILPPGQIETIICGSPGYVAPEILRKKGYDSKVDVFSLGVISYILYYNCSIIDLLERCRLMVKLLVNCVQKIWSAK